MARRGAGAVEHLQSALGNRGMGALIDLARGGEGVVAAPQRSAGGPVPALQAKLRIDRPGDLYERAADRAVDLVMGMRAPVAGGPVEEREGPLAGPDPYRPGARGMTADAPLGGEASRSLAAPRSGEPLDPGIRDFFEPRFGRDFGSVRIHTDEAAAAAARSIQARAFTFGRTIVFDRDAYRPETEEGRRLIAHELAHVVQQEEAGAAGGSAGRAAGGASQVRGGVGPQLSSAPPAIQRQVYGDSPTGVTDPDAVIPLDDFIRYVEEVESAYSSDSPEEILTRIRVQYYSGFAFERLIPGAPRTEVTGTQTIFNRQMGEVYEVPITRERRLDEDDLSSSTYEHLTARADENLKGDNPSPYVELPNGERIDLGHLLLGLDALLHPRTTSPYTDFSVPNIDPSSWVADIGIASVWMTEHEEEGDPHSDVPNPPSSPDLDAYYQQSAPEEDLLGDVDSFGLHAQWQATSGQTLSQVIRAYYKGTGSTSMEHRFQIFCAANGFGYTRTSTGITWDTDLRDRLIERVDRFCDLYAAGGMGAGWAMLGGSPSRRSWPRTPDVVDRFLEWVKTKLEAELAATSPVIVP